MFSFVEAPLIGYLVAPDWSHKQVVRFNGWLHRNGRHLGGWIGVAVGDLPARARDPDRCMSVAALGGPTRPARQCATAIFRTTTNTTQSEIRAGDGKRGQAARASRPAHSGAPRSPGSPGRPRARARRMCSRRRTPAAPSSSAALGPAAASRIAELAPRDRPSAPAPSRRWPRTMLSPSPWEYTWATQRTNSVVQTIAASSHGSLTFA